MAPDLNSISRSPRLSNAGLNASSQASPNLSRRTSAVMGPPPLPANSSLPNSPRPPAAVTADSQAFNQSIGPIRHPRPLTAAELHLEMEKEQESIVNRLTRELSALRTQTASVASTASSTSDLFTSNPSESYLYPHPSGIIPTSARRHRSSSNLSSRSARSARDALTSAATATSVSGVAAPRDRDHSHQPSSRPSIEMSRPQMSRQSSISGLGMQRSSSNTGQQLTASSPHWTTAGGQHHHQQPHSSRHSISSNYSAQAAEHARSPSLTAASAAARYEEAEKQRAELETVKRENEALKLRIRELEKSLKGERDASGNQA